MSSVPAKLGLIPSEQQNESEEEDVIVAAEVADLSLISELAPPPSSSSSSSSSSNLHNNNNSSTNLDGSKEEEELLQHFSHPHPLKLFFKVVRKEEEELLQHFSPPHPLNRFFEVVVEEEEGNNNNNNNNNNEDVQLTTSTVGGLGEKRVRCPGCLDDPVVVSDDDDDDVRPIYRCSLNPGAECEDEEDKEGFKFILHKSCAELPLNMVSSVHPQHPFQLFPAYSRDFICDICGGRILGFSYSCRPCDLDFHIKCASQYKFEPQIHPLQDHSFILFKPTTFTCDACGIDEETKMLSYLCTSCQIQVHLFKKCSSSSYPLTLKQIRHRHQLILTYSHQLLELGFDFSHKLCMICNNKMNSVLCVYYCSPCAYIAHLSCAIDEDLRDDHFENQLVAVESETTNEIQIQISPLGGSSQGEDLKLTELLPHFSHPHSLILSNEEPDQIDQLCDACALPLSVPFYTCPPTKEYQCNFSLHIQCATELHAEIRHPLHRHPLTLHAKHPSNDNGLFRCYGCWVFCNGFTYTCDECNRFSLCVGCSSFSDTLSHEGHQCPLKVIYSNKTKCNACDLVCYPRFMCAECNFHLDLRCASLPKVTMHNCPKPDWGIRPLKLTYSSVEDELGEYYCDICEKRRDQNHWFYYCEACDYSCHPQCVLGKNQIKFGKSCNLSIHPHPLTFVRKAKGLSTCIACHNSSKDSPLLVCAECDIYIHFHCTRNYRKQS